MLKCLNVSNTFVVYCTCRFFLMAGEIKQTQRLEQGIALTPQLKRSLEILQLPALELAELVSQELQTNPLLEDVSETPFAERPTVIGESADSLPDLDDSAESFSSQDSDVDDENAVSKKHDFALNSIPEKVSLQAHLLNESMLDASSPVVVQAFASLVAELDDRGFLTHQAFDNAKNTFGETIAKEALDLLRSSEPSGIGAFDMRDSLMLQLEHKNLGGTLAYRILENHYELLMKRKIKEIADAEYRSLEDVENAFSEIAKLNTSPAHDFASDDEHFIVPDVKYSFSDETGWKVELTNEYIPKIRINQEYRKLALRGDLNGEETTYISEKIKEGKFLIEAIANRQQTLLKIAKAILKLQPSFFENGISALKPMTMQDVADVVDVHSTTVGRAVADKYAQTPFGVFGLKFFFSTGFDSVDGESVANTSVKQRIAEIVDAELKTAPLSDSKIAEILASEGIVVARRTIAKYRDELGIAPKNLRKRFE